MFWFLSYQNRGISGARARALYGLMNETRRSSTKGDRRRFFSGSTTLLYRRRRATCSRRLPNVKRPRVAAAAAGQISGLRHASKYAADATLSRERDPTPGNGYPPSPDPMDPLTLRVYESPRIVYQYFVGTCIHEFSTKNKTV